MVNGTSTQRGGDKRQQTERGIGLLGADRSEKNNVDVGRQILTETPRQLRIGPDKPVTSIVTPGTKGVDVHDVQHGGGFPSVVYAGWDLTKSSCRGCIPLDLSNLPEV